MSQPNPPPSYVYKIMTCQPPSPLPDPFPPSGIDERDGFVHLSAPAQVPITAGFFFDDMTRLWVLKIRFADLADNIKWTVGDGYPHLHGTLSASDIVDVKEFNRADPQTWAEAMSCAWFE